MTFDLKKARRVLDEQAKATSAETVDPKWVKYVEEISKLCEAARIRTHVAFLGTALLAKATDPSADVYSVKLSSEEGGYSARTLAHEVLVPAASELGIHLGVTGREPLNNQPYLRMERFDDGTRIHRRAAAVFKRLTQVIEELSAVKQTEAEGALRSFIYVRKSYQPKYALPEGEYSLAPRELAEIIETFAAKQTDGGRLAQAVVAGLLDVFAGEERVFTGRINDPSRHYPGDVAVRSEDDTNWEKSFEVRDKQVKISDVFIFANKCLSEGVREVAVVAVTKGQAQLPEKDFEDWSKKTGVGIKVFTGWKSLVDEVLFWSPHPSTVAASLAIPRIHIRLIDIETSEDIVKSWLKLVAPHQMKETTTQ